MAYGQSHWLNWYLSQRILCNGWQNSVPTRWPWEYPVHQKRLMSWYVSQRGFSHNAQANDPPKQKDRLSHGVPHQRACRNTYQNHVKTRTCHTHQTEQCLNHRDIHAPTSQAQTPANHADGAPKPDKPVNTRAPLFLKAAHHAF